jgi:quinol-cytochrome oxidoreductase complex cytochrome b subunit
MGKAEMILLAILALVGFVLLTKMMISLIKKHGVSVKKGRKKSREEEIGYNPSKVSKTAATCALGCFLCGVMVALKPFRDDL